MRRNVFTMTFALALIAGAGATACGDGPSSTTPNRGQLADKWLVRAKAAYRSGDADDATVAIDGALKAAPKDPDTRLLAARIALAKLDFSEVVRLTENMPSSEAKGLRGRALWYSGDIERAADELEDMGKDPNVKDPWARDVAKLARRGQGRHPFAIEGAVVAAIEMPGGENGSPALVVPCELEGERILALVATNFGELMIDSASRKEPAWVNLRFGEKFEVKDVPALTHDLSNISRQLGATIKALIGVNVLRHMHATFDRRGSQFVVRKSEPPPPPEASKMPVFYARGGAMMMRAQVNSKDDGQTLLFVDSSAFYPLALEDVFLKKSGADLTKFRTAPGAPASWKMGELPFFKLGQVDLSQFPAVEGATVGDYKANFDVDIGGIIGAGLLSIFRVTFAEEGKWLWMELDPSLMPGGQTQQPVPERGPNGGPPPQTPPPDNTSGGSLTPGKPPTLTPPTQVPFAPQPSSSSSPPKPPPKSDPNPNPTGPSPGAKTEMGPKPPASATESKGAAK